MVLCCSQEQTPSSMCTCGHVLLSFLSVQRSDPRHKMPAQYIAQRISVVPDHVTFQPTAKCVVFAE